MNRPAITERDKAFLRIMFRVQSKRAFEKSEFRRRRDVKHFWPRRAEGRTA